MSPDDIDNIVLNLFEFLVVGLGCVLDEDEDFGMISNFMHNAFDDFCTRDRNYN